MSMNKSVQHQTATFGNIRVPISEQSYSSTVDTIHTENSGIKSASQNEQNIGTDNIDNQIIDFQVNSDISYLSTKHFVKDQSRNMFFEARLKENELKKVSIQTDSLRKVYANATSVEKEKISSLILKNEEHAMALNQEIQTLYQTARDQEDQYWQTLSTDEKIKFQEKIKSFRDSINNEKLKAETKKMIDLASDTILIFMKSQKEKEQKLETNSNTAIVYKIQIGAFKGKVPELSNKMIKKLSVLRKVENYNDEKGVTIYTTGNLKTYQEAVTLQNQVKQEGVKNSTIIAFQKGKKIAIDEARKITNEL